MPACKMPVRCRLPVYLNLVILITNVLYDPCVIARWDDSYTTVEEDFDSSDCYFSSDLLTRFVHTIV